MTFPVKNGRITQRYWRLHRALDVAPEKRGDRNTPCLSPEPGKVLYKGYDNRNGHWIGIQGKRAYHFFGHFAKASPLRIRSNVKEGQKIGILGSTGWSTGVHTHWVVRVPNRSGKKVDPHAFYKKWSKPAPKPKKIYLKVRRGEGLSHLAKRAGYRDYWSPYRWSRIAKLNGKSNWWRYNRSLKTGQRVRVR